MKIVTDFTLKIGDTFGDDVTGGDGSGGQCTLNMEVDKVADMMTDMEVDRVVDMVTLQM